MMLFAFAPASVSAAGDAGDGSGQAAGAEETGGGTPGTDVNQCTGGTGNGEVTDPVTTDAGDVQTLEDPSPAGGGTGTG